MFRIRGHREPVARLDDGVAERPQVVEDAQLDAALAVQLEQVADRRDIERRRARRRPPSSRRRRATARTRRPRTGTRRAGTLASARPTPPRWRAPGRTGRSEPVGRRAVLGPEGDAGAVAREPEQRGVDARRSPTPSAAGPGWWPARAARSARSPDPRCSARGARDRCSCRAAMGRTACQGPRSQDRGHRTARPMSPAGAAPAGWQHADRDPRRARGARTRPPSSRPTTGCGRRQRRRLTLGLVITITLVAFEALAISTVMPVVSDDLGGLGLYGWVFSGFFLGNLLGIVVAGPGRRPAGHRAPVRSSASCCSPPGSASAAWRRRWACSSPPGCSQGIGAGAIPAVAYASVGRAYPAAIRPRVFAVFSTAWVVPGPHRPGVEQRHRGGAQLAGRVPGPAAVRRARRPSSRSRPSPARPSVADGDDAERVPDRRGPARRPHRWPSRSCSSRSAGHPSWIAVAAARSSRRPIAVPHVRPARAAGHAAPGARACPPRSLVRGILTFAFFGADAYVSLTFQDVRDQPTWVAGVALTGATLGWTAAAWIQQRWILTRRARGASSRTGFAFLARRDRRHGRRRSATLPIPRLHRGLVDGRLRHRPGLLPALGHRPRPGRARHARAPPAAASSSPTSSASPSAPAWAAPSSPSARPRAGPPAAPSPSPSRSPWPRPCSASSPPAASPRPCPADRPLRRQLGCEGRRSCRSSHPSSRLWRSSGRGRVSRGQAKCSSTTSTRRRPVSMGPRSLRSMATPAPSRAVPPAASQVHVGRAAVMARVS